jgi:hypothetical protein
MKLPPSHQGSPRHTEWLARVIQLESEGLDTSDAQGIADMEAEQNMKEAIKKKIINKLGISQEWAKDHLIVM